MNRFVILSIIFLFLLGIGGCTEKVSRGVSGKKKTVTIEGAESMALMIKALGEEFMKTNNDVEIVFFQNSSLDGIFSVINKTADIGASSRAIYDSELKKGAEKGVEIHEYMLAKDAVVFAVNGENKLKSMKITEIAQILCGDIYNWKHFGGEDLPIDLYSLKDGSGLVDYIKNRILVSHDFSSLAVTMDDMSDITGTVAVNKNAFAFLPYEYASLSLNSIKILDLEDDSGQKITTDVSNINSGKYPFVRNLYLYCGNTNRPEIARFIKFCLSAEGRKIIKKNGYF